MSKKSEKNNSYKRTSIGGQAVIEGIMMNGPHRSVLAVRSDKGDIIVEDVAKPNYREKCKLFKLPIIRGVVAYIESMVLGYKTLMRSADLSGMTDLDDDEDESSAKSADEKAQPCEDKIDKKSSDNTKKEEQKKDSGAFVGVIMGVASVLGTLLAMFLFMYLPTLFFNLIDGSVGNVLSAYRLRALIEGLMKLAIFIGYIMLVSLTKDIKRVFQYHGAEHKTIFCYEHGLELTVENVKKQRRFHPRCGTSFLFLMIAVGILLSTVLSLIPHITDIAIVWVLIKILFIPAFCGVGYELLKLCGKYDNLATKIIAAPGLWIQRLTTKEPDDSMMEVAIESIKAVIPENPDDDRIG